MGAIASMFGGTGTAATGTTGATGSAASGSTAAGTGASAGAATGTGAAMVGVPGSTATGTTLTELSALAAETAPTTLRTIMLKTAETMKGFGKAVGENAIDAAIGPYKGTVDQFTKATTAREYGEATGNALAQVGLQSSRSATPARSLPLPARTTSVDYGAPRQRLAMLASQAPETKNRFNSNFDKARGM